MAFIDPEMKRNKKKRSSITGPIDGNPPNFTFIVFIVHF